MQSNVETDNLQHLNEIGVANIDQAGFLLLVNYISNA